jgi:broad specificity phosphatase PhoE
MAKTIHLVRHGHHPLLGYKLCGRMPGVELDEFGREEISRSCELIASKPSQIQSSPQQRAIQSAEIIAAHFGVPVEIALPADEIDVGDWTSLPFKELADDPRWQHWNCQRAIALPPHGESMRSLQGRMVRHLDRLRSDPADTTTVIVSHAEPIRAALLHYLGIPLNEFLAIEIDPGSVSTLHIADNTVRVAEVNRRAVA